jgi:HEAT repeat protein
MAYFWGKFRGRSQAARARGKDFRRVRRRRAYTSQVKHGMLGMHTITRRLGCCIFLSAVGTSLAFRASAAGQQDADALVQQLSGLPAELYAGPMSILCGPQPSPCSPPPLPPAEAKRQQIESQLHALGSAGVLALARGLGSADVSVRSNAALMLIVLSEGLEYSAPASTKIDISAALSALITTLDDPDFRARGLAAQAIGDIGAYAAPAVPALIKMLTSKDEGLRNSACIGLRGVGPPARDALPALRRALSDPSKDVRRFATLAIASIEGRLSQ